VRLHQLPVAWALACTTLLSLGRPTSSTAGEAAAPFNLRTLDGKPLRSADFKGQPMVVDFWATWCTPCRATMPHLDALQQHFRDSGLVVIGFSVDDGSPQQVKRYAEKLGVKMRLAMAPGSMLEDYGPIRSIPTTFFIDRRGMIVRRVVGYVDGETMETFAREIVAR
jgi:thiol-disulfide isomerase/thioredoxin